MLIDLKEVFSFHFSDLWVKEQRMLYVVQTAEKRVICVTGYLSNKTNDKELIQ